MKLKTRRFHIDPLGGKSWRILQSPSLSICEYKKLIQILTEVSSMNIEDAHILNTSKDLKHALALSVLAFMRLSEIMHMLYDKCSDELNHRGYSFTHEGLNTFDKYWLPEGKQKTSPSIVHVIDETAIGTKTKLKFVIELSCQDNLFWTLHFVKDGIKSHNVTLTPNTLVSNEIQYF